MAAEPRSVCADAFHDACQLAHTEMDGSPVYTVRGYFSIWSVGDFSISLRTDPGASSAYPSAGVFVAHSRLRVHLDVFNRDFLEGPPVSAFRDGRHLLAYAAALLSAFAQRRPKPHEPWGSVLGDSRRGPILDVEADFRCMFRNTCAGGVWKQDEVPLLRPEATFTGDFLDFLGIVRATLQESDVS